MVSTVYQVTCGVSTTLSRPSSGLSGSYRFDAEDIQAGGGQPAVAQRVGQRVFVDDRAARGVDQYRSGFHPGQRGPSSSPSVSVGQRQVQRDDVAGGQQFRQRPPAGQAVVAGAGVQHRGAHRGDDVRDPFGDVAVADQPDVQAPISRTVSPSCGSDGQPRPSRVARSSAGRRRRAANISSTVPSATDGALAPGMLATAMPCLVAASTSMVLTPAPNLCTSRSAGARAGRRRKAAAAHARSRRPRVTRGRTSRRRRTSGCRANRLRPQGSPAPWAGDEVSEDPQRHRLAIHLAMVSACSLRAPGVVK